MSKQTKNKEIEPDIGQLEDELKAELLGLVSKFTTQSSKRRFALEFMQLVGRHYNGTIPAMWAEWEANIHLNKEFSRNYSGVV